MPDAAGVLPPAIKSRFIGGVSDGFFFVESGKPASWTLLVSLPGTVPFASFNKTSTWAIEKKKKRKKNVSISYDNRYVPYVGDRILDRKRGGGMGKR